MSRLFPPPSLSLDLMEKQPSSASSELTPTRLGFPNEFPYEFDSPVFSPGFTSPGDSTETEDESSDDEEDFLAGLTRRLAPSAHRLPPPSSTISKTEEKRKVVASTSPQSTLSGLGSFSSSSGSRSPVFTQPQAPKRDNAYDVISAAAGEVARLKLGTHESHLPRHNLVSPPTNTMLRRQQNAAFQAEQHLLLQQQRILDQMWLCSQSRIHKPSPVQNRGVNDELLLEKMRYMRQSATWLPPQHVVSPLPKRPSVGTGVFLPRRYPTPTQAPSDSLKRPVAPILPSKVHPQNLYYDEPRRSQFDYECMFGRSTLAPRQRAVNCLNQERRLPQDWMY